MFSTGKFRPFLALVILAAVATSAPAYAGLNLDEGMWRLELGNSFGVHQGSQDRSGDYNVIGFADYEVPATARTTLGLRLMPLFLYNQDVDKDRHRPFRRWFDDEHNDDDTVWGAGVGLTGRIYQIKDEYRGWYGEIGVTAFVHNNEFAGNNSNLNFLSTFGVGYQFKKNWHVQAHYQHISNASLGSRNSGANTLGIGLGYRF